MLHDITYCKQQLRLVTVANRETEALITSTFRWITAQSQHPSVRTWQQSRRYGHNHHTSS